MIVDLGIINGLTIYKATSPFPNTLILLISFRGDSSEKEHHPQIKLFPNNINHQTSRPMCPDNQALFNIRGF